MTPPGRGGIVGPRQRPANPRAGVLAAVNIQQQNIASQAAGNGREVIHVDTIDVTYMRRTRAIDQADLLTDMSLSMNTVVSKLTDCLTNKTKPLYNQI